MNYDRLVAAAREAGAAKATVINREQIVLSRSFRDICAGNGCGNYGRCWMCPPDVGEIDTLMEKVGCFPRGLLYQSIVPLEDSFDIEGMTAGARAHARLSLRVDDAVRPLLLGERFHLSCGGCRLCDRCTKPDGLPCRHPEQALPSLESCGIDVYNTVRDTDLHYTNGQNTVTFFGLLLFSEVRHG